MDWRTNAGYIITNSITVGNTEIVLGVHTENPDSFVTWLCRDKNYYYWGHYYSDLLSAQKDFLKRGLAEVRTIEQHKHRHKTYDEKER